MSPFEIALIIIGIGCIIASCFFVEGKNSHTVETELGTVSEQILYSQLSEANSKISEHVNQLREEAYEKTKEEMNQISNEKIMAVHEYSDQVLGDIKKSHEEVMFLYQMLNDKEAELKKSLQEMQQTKREIERYCSRVVDKQEMESHIERQKAEEKHEPRKKKETAETSHTQSRTSKKNKVNTTGKNLLEIADIDEDNHYSKTLQDIENQEFSSHIEEILELSNQGMNVIDISKRLGLGQGEVKLVLDYHKK